MRLPTRIVTSGLILSIACACDVPQPDSSPASPAQSDSVLLSDEGPGRVTADSSPSDLSPTPAPTQHDTVSHRDCVVVDVEALRPDVIDAAASAANTVTRLLSTLVQTIHNAHDTCAVNNALIQGADPTSPPTVDRAADIIALPSALPSIAMGSLETAFRDFLGNGDGVTMSRAHQDIERRVNAIIDGTAAPDPSTARLADRIHADYGITIGRSLDGALAQLPAGLAPLGVSSGRDLRNFAAIVPVDSLLESSGRAVDFARDATDHFARAYRAYSLAAAAAHHVDVAATEADACDAALRAGASLDIARLAGVALEASGPHLGSVMLASRREAGNAVSRYRATYYGARPW